MMKTTSFFLFFLSALLATTFVGCPKPTDNLGSVELQLKTTYGSQPFVLYTQYGYKTPRKIQFDKVQFYISDIKLISGQREMAVLDNIFIDLAKYNTTPALAAQYATIGTADNSIVPDTYTAIRFGIGVSPAFNKTRPSDYANGQPLANSDMYWSVWDSYIFANIEGKLDTLVGTVPRPLQFAYHTGTDSLYRTVTLPISSVVQGGQKNTISIALDVQKIFATSLDTLNIAGAPIPKIPPVLTPEIMILHHLVENFAKAFK